MTIQELEIQHTTKMKAINPFDIFDKKEVLKMLKDNKKEEQKIKKELKNLDNWGFFNNNGYSFLQNKYLEKIYIKDLSIPKIEKMITYYRSYHIKFFNPIISQSFENVIVSQLLRIKKQKEYKLKLATMIDEEKSQIKSIDLDSIKLINPELILGRPVNNNQNISCPFHEDTNPSFRWYHKTNSFHCFSCQTHGSIIDLYMKLNDCDFKTAINHLSTVLT